MSTFLCGRISLGVELLGHMLSLGLTFSSLALTAPLRHCSSHEKVPTTDTCTPLLTSAHREDRRRQRLEKKEGISGIMH